jgi:hypothetical protein
MRSVELLSTITNICKGGLVSHCIKGRKKISESLSGWLLPLAMATSEIMIRRIIGL